MMNIDQLHAFIIQADISEIIKYVSLNKNSIKVLFGNLDLSTASKKRCKELTSYLHTLKKKDKSTEELQLLFTSLAFYFMKAKSAPLVSACKNNLQDSILKHRLEAWHKYKTYTSKKSHVKLFPEYLKILSRAVADEFEDYTEDVLLDLYNYNNDFGHVEDFKKQFDDVNLLNQFPLLQEYHVQKDFLKYRTVEDSIIGKIYTPSVFTENLFNKKFIDFIKFHRKTNWYEILLGYASYDVRRDIIKYGQAEFDNNYKELTAEEVVKLYCYFNMRKHYYSSLYLFESNTWIKDLIKEGNVKFIDIGCGPATSGIALVDHLLSEGEPIDSFDYIGIDYYQSMLNAASDIMDNEVFDLTKGSYIKGLDLIDNTDAKNVNSILINTCYLFASPTLDVVNLANDINLFLKNYPDIPQFLLFQNTPDFQKNEKYRLFKKLVNHKVISKSKSEVKYNNQRGSYREPTKETVSFEILKFI